MVEKICTRSPYKPETAIAWVISTGYVTRDDMQLIERDKLLRTSASYPEGCFISIPTDPDYWLEFLEDLESRGYSEAFQRLCLLAHAGGAQLIQLDADGDRGADTLPLPVQDW